MRSSEITNVLRATGEQLSERARRGVLALGGDAIPPLLAILNDDELVLAPSEGEEFAAIHAAKLLGELRAEAAIEPMLRRLAETDWNDWIHDTILLALPAFGAAVVEPTLRAYHETTDAEARSAYASVLAEAGVRDQRIFEILVGMVASEPLTAAIHLAGYGDPDAVPALVQAFDECGLSRAANPVANQVVLELRDAIERLGGTLTAAQEAKYDAAMEPRRRWASTLPAVAPTQRRERPGRNDPCWCGAARKYKKCHLTEDERVAREEARD